MRTVNRLRELARTATAGLAAGAMAGINQCWYLAVLPNDPETTVSDLEATCRSISDSDSDSTTAGFTLVRWLQSRAASLRHPALSKPLPYLEIMAHVKLHDQSMEHAAFDTFSAQLCSAAPSGRIGNAELVQSMSCPMPLLPSELPMVALSTTAYATLEDGAAAFRSHGLLAMQQALDASELADLRLGVETRFDECLSALRRAEASGRGTHFSEIMQRDTGRYDCRLQEMSSLGPDAGTDLSPPVQDIAAGTDEQDAPPTACWTHTAFNGAWVPLVRQLLGGDCRVVRCGCVVSLPGCGEQYWHSDGAHIGSSATWADIDDPAGAAAPPHAICVFVPLVDLSEDNGYTEFWSGSHHFAQLMDKKGEQSLPGGTKAILPAGGALLYDFRTIHRGMPNHSQKKRPIFYTIYAHANWQEKRNWDDKSVFPES